MIENESLKNILLYAGDISAVCEIYPSGTAPTADGFDPIDAIECFAAVGTSDLITFRSRTYKRLVKRFGSVSKTIKKEKKAATVEFCNLSREISQFHFNGVGFEGLILVIRLLSRQSSVELADTQILFTGKCDKPKGGNKDSLTVSANFILHGLDVTFPRRKYTENDAEGRVPADPLFEGFRFMPPYGTTAFPRRERRGGFLGFLGFKKQVMATIQWSPFSDLDANTYVSEVLGQAQIKGVYIGAVDVGTQIRFRIAWCEGLIADIINQRSADSTLPLSPTSYSEIYGLLGAANNLDPSWVAPGNYSRTALSCGQADNSAIDVNEPPPDIVAIIKGRIMATPNPATGLWTIDEWTDNGAAHTRWALTSQDYFKLDANWIENAAAADTFNFNGEFIFNTSVSDFLFVSAA